MTLRTLASTAVLTIEALVSQLEKASANNARLTKQEEERTYARAQELNDAQEAIRSGEAALHEAMENVAREKQNAAAEKRALADLKQKLGAFFSDLTLATLFESTLNDSVPMLHFEDAALLEKELQEFVDFGAQLTKEKTSLAHLLAKERANAARLEDVVAEQKSGMQQLEEAGAQLNSQHKEELATLAHETAALQSTIQTREKEVADKQAEIVALAQTCEDQRKQQAEVSDRLKKDISGLEGSIAELKNTNQALSEEIKRLEEAHAGTTEAMKKKLKLIGADTLDDALVKWQALQCHVLMAELMQAEEEGRRQLVLQSASTLPLASLISPVAILAEVSSLFPDKSLVALPAAVASLLGADALLGPKGRAPGPQRGELLDFYTRLSRLLPPNRSCAELLTALRTRSRE
ncbi:hypothetical protein STCU_11093 [Strigomonas culicis]|uniref:Uncharacterized protein n=1 Tax=Strigomonas culicis TaxID=28005 RepID=S9UPU4_9TRYP|nr:hypothetical protein STCU_11093 [Strigomonas culicis]|eukprot:EPY16636.1 hypothetical protein STCU_11093 [Strigomonas culicis]